MAKCNTCGKIADEESTVCSNCGRPNPTKMRGGEVLGLILGIPIGLAALIYSTNDDSKPASASQVESTATVAEQNQVLPESIPIADDHSNAAESDVVDAPESNIPSSLETNEVKTPSKSDTQTQEFSYSAHLVDSRGHVVIQSEASMLSKNVTSVATGTHVQASSKDGKWVSVQLDDGQVGFVRQKQLQFE